MKLFKYIDDLDKYTKNGDKKDNKKPVDIWKGLKIFAILFFAFIVTVVILFFVIYSNITA